jgi:hypothetical protein
MKKCLEGSCKNGVMMKTRKKDIGPQAMDEKGNTCIVGEC